MESSEISKSFYSKLDADGLSRQTNKFRTKETIRFAERYIEKKDKILDLCCGYGRITIPLAKKGYDIEGIDLADNMIKCAKKNAKEKNMKIKFKVGDMCNLPYDDYLFDTVICLWASFNHLLYKKDQIKAINEIYRVMKPGGIAIFDMPNGDRKDIKARVDKEGKGPDKRWAEDYFEKHKNIFYMHNKKTLAYICKKSKFKKYKTKLENLYEHKRIIMVLEKE